MVTQLEIARRCDLDVSSVNKILNRKPGAVFKRVTIMKVFKIARELGYSLERLKHDHRRRFPRKEVRIGAELAIYNSDGSLRDQGVATIRNVSLGGARVTDVALPSNSIPVQPFTIGLRPMQGPADGVEFRGRIVRLAMNGVLGYGIEFLEVEPKSARRLGEIVSNPRGG